MNDAEAQAAIARRLRRQARYCTELGSPLYAALLEQVAADSEAGGPAWRLLRGHERDAPGSALALRLMGGVHRLVLEGRLPELARFYPSAGGDSRRDGAGAALITALEAEREALRPLLDRPVQTNEVWRSAALLGGFCVVAAETRLPLRVLEVGASAGLNLRFDRYSYSSSGVRWGDDRSAVRFEDLYRNGRTPPHGIALEVTGRRGCDARPLDPSSVEDRLTLLSFVWPDQESRFDLLRRALELACVIPAQVDRADAAEWAERMLSRPAPGAATVLFHSIVMQYLDEATANRFVAAIEDAGRRATPAAPFAWLRLEAGGELAEVRLRLWPGGQERLLASCGFQRGPIDWHG
jgi:hypothetical protein